MAKDDEMPGSRTDIAQMAYEGLQGHRELVQIEGGHFGLLYYPGPIFDAACESETAFLVRHLASPAQVTHPGHFAPL
jgi:hypothetical protein